MFISVNVTAFSVNQICRNSVTERITEVVSSISIESYNLNLRVHLNVFIYPPKQVLPKSVFM